MIPNSLVGFLISRGGGIFRFSAKKAHVVCQRGIWVHASFYDHSTALSPYSAPNGVLCSPHIARSHVSESRHGAPGQICGLKHFHCYCDAGVVPSQLAAARWGTRRPQDDNILFNPTQAKRWLVWPNRDVNSKPRQEIGDNENGP